MRYNYVVHGLKAISAKIPFLVFFVNSNSTNYPEGDTFYKISISAFIYEIWPVEVSKNFL